MSSDQLDSDISNSCRSAYRHLLFYRTKIAPSIIVRFIVVAGLIFLCLSPTVLTINNNSINVNAAYAQLANNNNSIFLDNSPEADKPPAFLDSFWTTNLSVNSSVPSNNIAKTEVGPGDGVATLAVVLVNRGRTQLTGVTGYLNLPEGFKPIPGKNNGTSQSVAGYYSVVNAGNTFVLYFDVNVLKQAKVGGYSTPLTLKYSKILQMGQLTTTVTVPFRLTGRVILSPTSENKELIPASPNILKIRIQNTGTADANSVVATITGSTGSSTSSSSTTSAVTTTSSSSSNATSTQQQAASSPALPSSSSSIPTVNVGSQTFYLGKILANGSSEIDPILYPTSSAGETAQNLNLQITYGDAYGNQKTLNGLVGIVIAPNPPQSVLNLTTNNGNALILTAGKIGNVEFTLQNNDKNPITDVVASLNSQTDAMKILGDSRWTVQSMAPQSKMNMFTKVFATPTLVGTPTLLTLTVQYVSQGQSKIDSLNLGAYITGEIKVRVYGVQVTNVGNVPNLTGNLLNEGNTVGLFTTVQIVKNQPQSSVTSSSPTPSSSGSSKTAHNRNLQHNGSESNQKSLGDFLNPLPPYQFLGDLSVDSPLPFSIPLVSADNKTITAPAGNYPVALKITYSDDLKIPHQLVDTNETVNFQPPSSSTSRHQGGGVLAGLQNILLGSGQKGAGSGNDMYRIILIAAIAAASIAAVVLYIRKRRSRPKLKKSQATEHTIEESLLDDITPDKDISQKTDDIDSIKRR